MKYYRKNTRSNLLNNNLIITIIIFSSRIFRLNEINRYLNFSKNSRSERVSGNQAEEARLSAELNIHID
jgi:hypothetical protein